VSTPGGEKALRARIEETATEVCKRIGTFYPAASMEHADQQTCVKGAVDSAMKQASVGFAKPLG